MGKLRITEHNTVVTEKGTRLGKAVYVNALQYALFIPETGMSLDVSMLLKVSAVLGEFERSKKNG